MLRIGIVIPMCLVLVGIAYGESTIGTGALQATASNRLVCRVTNVSAKPVLVMTAHVVQDASPGTDTTGGLGFNECDGITLAPGAGCRTASTVSLNPLIGHCSVVFKGNRTALRAALWLADGSFNMLGPVLSGN